MESDRGAGIVWGRWLSWHVCKMISGEVNLKLVRIIRLVVLETIKIQKSALLVARNFDQTSCQYAMSSPRQVVCSH